MQFQEKLEELTPLPEMLKIAHQKLHESQQLRAISERSVEQLNKETTDLKAEVSSERCTVNDRIIMKQIHSLPNLTSKPYKKKKKIDDLILLTSPPIQIYVY